MLIFPAAILAIEDENDREFMKQLYIEHHLSMYRMARALSHSLPDAEDIVSEACVALIRKIPVLRALDCNVLQGYIISTVKNAAYALHRKRNSHREIEDGETLLNRMMDHSPPPDARILLQNDIEELMQAIKSLSEGDQAVIRMKYFQKYSDREIAEALGIQEGSVRAKLTRARQRIYKFLEEIQDEKK